MKMTKLQRPNVAMKIPTNLTSAPNQKCVLVKGHISYPSLSNLFDTGNGAL